MARIFAVDMNRLKPKLWLLYVIAIDSLNAAGQKNSIFSPLDNGHYFVLSLTLDFMLKWHRIGNKEMFFSLHII